MALDFTGADADLLDPIAVITGSAYPSRGEDAPRSDYTLTRRQERLYLFRADIYQPVQGDLDNDQAAVDSPWQTPALATCVPCWKRKSEESIEVNAIGRTNVSPDTFEFPLGVMIADGYLIKLYPLDPLSEPSSEGSIALQDVGEVQGGGMGVIWYKAKTGPKDRYAAGSRRANHRVVPALAIAPPKGLC